MAGLLALENCASDSSDAWIYTQLCSSWPLQSSAHASWIGGVSSSKKEFFLRGQARWKRFAYVIQQKQTECCFAAVAVGRRRPLSSWCQPESRRLISSSGASQPISNGRRCEEHSAVCEASSNGWQNHISWEAKNSTKPGQHCVWSIFELVIESRQGKALGEAVWSALSAANLRLSSS